jgi:hypothetical protein
MKAIGLVLVTACLTCGTAGRGYAQGFSTVNNKPRPWSRVSFFTTGSQTTFDDGTQTAFTEWTTSVSYQLPDLDDAGAEYGLDIRYANAGTRAHPQRVSLYEGFVGARLARGAVRFRLGHLWLNDLASLGSVAGATIEVRQPRVSADAGRFRFGGFAGFEPDILELGYADKVRKFGAYLGYDGANARRHSLGYVLVRQGSLTERAVLTTTNFLPVRRKLFMYQAVEYNLQQPVGLGRRGLAYFFSNTRVNPVERLEIQGTYSRGRSIDARGLGQDVLNGRAITQRAVDGLLYESVGGRVTTRVHTRVRLYAGYSRDKNDRDAAPTNRILIGGYASNVVRSGFDVSASDSLMGRPDGSYHSRYISIGRSIGRAVYLNGDYSNSLSVVRFSRSDGITIETKPHATRVSSTVTATLTHGISVLGTVERTREHDSVDIRMLSGITYRIR